MIRNLRLQEPDLSPSSADHADLKTEIQIGHRSDREVEVTSGVAEGVGYYAAAEVKDMSAKMN